MSSDPQGRIARRRFLAIGGAGLAGTALAACTGGTGQATPSPPPTPSASPVNAATPGDRRIFYKRNPFLEESRPNLIEGDLTPTDLHFVRWHGAQAQVTAADYHLAISGKVGKPMSLALDDLMRLPSRTVTAVIECAGNGRGYFPASPKVSGTPWHYGAASCSQWTGRFAKHPFGGSRPRPRCDATGLRWWRRHAGHPCPPEGQSP
ncbi:MAG: hypothetical protein NVSMB17_06910 [Candidatus Dormibacteria bacterium]